MAEKFDVKTLKPGVELTPITKSMTQEKINLYVSAAEDYNPIHTDPEFARKTPFKRTIAPGYQFLSYISELMTRDFGKHWILSGVMDVRLLKPVFPGDTLEIGGKVSEVVEEKGVQIIRLNVYIRNQESADVVVGSAEVRY